MVDGISVRSSGASRKSTARGHLNGGRVLGIHGETSALLGHLDRMAHSAVILKSQ